jgi:hypothetical protein
MAKLGRAAGIVVLTAMLFGSSFNCSKRENVPMTPPVDLRRLTFPTAGVTVKEQSARNLLLATHDWILSAFSVDSLRASNIQAALRGVVARSQECREDVLKAPGAPVVYRVLRGVGEPGWAAQADYLISFPDGWVVARPIPRVLTDRFDMRPFDELLLAFRLAEAPRLDVEIPPAWRAYQSTRGPDSPIGKFVLSMAPAPVLIGNIERVGEGWAAFTDSEYERGGRSLAPDLIEFYGKDDPTSIRVDVWLDSLPLGEDRVAVFDGRLQVEQPRIQVASTHEPYEVSVPLGDYEVSVTLIHRGEHSERFLTDDERFARDDLERYEVLLRRASLSRDRE